MQLFYVIGLSTVHLRIKDMHGALALMRFYKLINSQLETRMPDLTVFFDINPEEGLARITTTVSVKKIDWIKKV